MRGFLRTVALTVFFSIIITILLPIGRVTSYAETKNFSVSFSNPKWKSDEFYYSNVSITSSTGSHINTLSIFVNDGTISYLPDASLWHTDLTQNGGHKTAIRTFSGTSANSADIAAIIKQVRFKLDSNSKNIELNIIVDGQDTTMPTVAGYTVTRGTGNHYYVYVPELLDWDKAYAKAKALEFMGMQGYLVTITSNAEDRLLDNITTVGAWAGAVRVPKTLDSAVFNKDTVWADYDIPNDPAESVWKWVCGPEAGQKIRITGGYNQTNQGVEDPGGTTYSNWNRNSSEEDQGNEPNNFFPGEFCMSVHYHNKGEAGTESNPVKGWNDLPNHVENLHEDYITGYFVEFDGLDITTPLTVSVTKSENYSHTWNYEPVTDSDGDTEIKADCIDPDHEECQYSQEGTPLKLYIDMSDHTYNAAPATSAKIKMTGVSDSKVAETITEAGIVLDGSIMYSGTDLDGKAYGPSTTPPTKTGNYTAFQKATAGGENYTISSRFEIKKASLTVTLKDQNVIKGQPISMAPSSAIESTTGLKGSDEITALVLEADNERVGKNKIDKSSSSAKPVVVKSGTEDVTSCYSITVVPAELTVGAKTPSVSTDAVGSEITYGKKLSDSTISGTVKDPDTGVVVSGTFEWKTPNVRPEVSDSNSTKYEVIFTPDSSDYEKITLEATLPVVRKDICSDDIDRTISLDLSNLPVATLNDSETNRTLTEGTDYTVSSVRKGDKQEVTITGIGNYKNSFTVTVDRHNWTGRIVKQIVIDTSADELNPKVAAISDSKNEKIGISIISDKLSGGTTDDEKLAKTIVDDVRNTGKSYDGDFNGLISLLISNADSTVTGAEKACAESAINPGRKGDSVRIPKNAVIGMYFDVSLEAEYKVVNKSVNPEKTIADSSDAVIDTSAVSLGDCAYSEKITVTVPERLRTEKGYSRTYYIIRVHDDGIGSLEWTAMPVARSGYSLTFSTDKFSKYAIAYVQTKDSAGSPNTNSNSNQNTDTESNSSSSSSSSNSTTTVVVSTPSAVNNTTVQVTAPKTGDSIAPFAALIIMIAGFVLLYIAVYVRKEDRV